MSAGKRELVLGKVLSMGESSRSRFEVRVGRWVEQDSGAATDCAVIVQQRRIGEFGYGRPFKLVVELGEIGTVLDGLTAWAAAQRAETLGRFFVSSVADE